MSSYQTNESTFMTLGEIANQLAQKKAKPALKEFTFTQSDGY